MPAVIALDTSVATNAWNCSPPGTSRKSETNPFTMVPFVAALMTFGADRIMFSVDYPFASNARARAFLDALPVSPADRVKIAHGNADRLMNLAI